MEKETSFFAKLISYGPGRRTAEVVVLNPDPRGGTTRSGKPRRISQTIHVEPNGSTWKDKDGNAYLF